MLQTKIKRKNKINTHILFQISFFGGDRAIYEIIWKNTVESDSAQMTT
jgi:hypothetical protein